MKKGLFSLFFFLVGCSSQTKDTEENTIMYFFLSDDWIEEEATAIIESAEYWEQEIGIDFFEFGGYISHNEGFHNEDMYDGLMVIYPFSRSSINEDIASLLEYEGGFSGYYLGDILLFRALDFEEVDENICYTQRDSVYICNTREEIYENPSFSHYINEFLPRVSTHEFGHAIGLDDHDEAPSIMEGNSSEITGIDIENVCKIYSCSNI